MNHPFDGVRYFLSGFSLIAKPGLRRFIILPLLINIVIFVGLFFLAQHFMSELNAWIIHLLPSWLQWLGIVVWLLFFIGFLLVAMFTFVALGNVIAAPFNSFLAEKVELYLTGALPPQQSIWQSVKTIPHSLGRQLAVVFYYVPRVLLLFILFFVPVLQMFAPVGWFLFNAWFMTLTYLDYPTDNHRVSFKDMRLWLEGNRFVALGFGVSVLLALMIPGINLLVMPAAVAGATKFWLEEKIS